MKNVDSKLLLGLVVGAAVGTAVGYLAATDKKDEIIGELGSLIDKAKEGFDAALSKYKTPKEEASVPEILAE